MQLLGGAGDCRFAHRCDVEAVEGEGAPGPVQDDEPAADDVDHVVEVVSVRDAV